MAHENRGRLAVDPDGNWRLCTATCRKASKSLALSPTRMAKKARWCGFLRRGFTHRSSLGRHEASTAKKVRAALGIQGRPTLLEGGKRINVYLDAESLDTAQKIGGGNASEGIRIALARAI